MTKARDIHERFWEKVPVRPQKPDACWEWTAFRNPGGYGMFGVKKSTPRLAHRVAWKLSGGEIPDGMELDHICRNRGCVRPDHLRVVPFGFNGRQGGSRFG